MKKKYIIHIISLCIILGCIKPDKGFLSDNIYYLPNPFTAPQGGITSSKPLQTDGSTDPMNVKLLEVRNKKTGQVANELLKEHEIQVFTGAVTFEDNTVELLNKKLAKRMFKPLNIAPIGGRIEVSPASEFVDTSTYEVDIEVSNIKGSRVIKNAVDIRLTAKKHYDLISSANTSSVSGNEVTFTSVSGGFPVTVTHIPTGPNKIILKFVDKNDVPFNPKTGQVINRGDRPSFADLDPYFAEEKTDTALVFTYPVVPFPLFTNQGKFGTSYNNYLSYYRVIAAANDKNLNYNPTIAFRIYSTGTWIFTGKILPATKK